MRCRIGDISIHYEVMGEGKPIVLLHGYYPDYRLMSGCMEPVFQQRKGYKRVYIDLPGMGQSQSADWIISSDDMLDVVFQAIETILPGENFLLAGESYGGYLSRGVLRKAAHRVDGLLLICPAIVTDSGKRNLPEHTVLASDASLLARLTKEEAEGFCANDTVQTEEVYLRYRNEIECGVKLANDAFLKRLRQTGYGFSFDVDGPNGRYEKPTLFLAGRQDSVVGYRDAWAILENYPRATFAVLDRAAHNLQIEQSGLFSALVLEWLDRVEECS